MFAPTRTLPVLALAGLSALSAPATVTAADYTAFTGKRTIALNTSATGANVAGTVTNFPVLIRLGRADSAILNGANGGNSIRFSKADDTTALPYQIEHWSPTHAAIWVKVDSVKGNNSTQTIRLHYNNASATSLSSGAAVFDTANAFSGVWHLSDSTGGLSADATIHNTNAAWYNGPVLAPGLIGRAVNLRQPVDIGLGPENARYLMANYNETNHNFKATSANGITLSAWVKQNTNSGGNEQGILGRYNWGQNGRQAMIALNANGEIRLFRSTNGTNSGGAETNFGTELITDGVWTHITATVKNGSQILYVNGVQNVAQTTATIGSLDSIWPTKSQLTFGRMAADHTGNPVHQAFDGFIDEARYARVARSADWVKLEYESQKPGQTLTNIGAPTTPGAPSNVTGVPGSLNTGAVILSWNAPDYDGFSSVTSYKAMAVGDTAKNCTALGQQTCVVVGLTAGAPYTFVVRAYNSVGGGSVSAASATINAPTGILKGEAVLRNAGAFTGAHTFTLSDKLAAHTGRLTMRILDVSGKTVWDRSLSSADAGRSITWNGMTTTGARAASGLYFVRVFAVTNAGTVEAVQGAVTVR